MRRQVLAVAVLFFCGLTVFNSVWAGPPADTAACRITVRVAPIMEWAGDFSAIDLGIIGAQGDVLTASASVILYTNGDADITADRSTSAELSAEEGGTLYTEHKLEYDGDGVTATGGATVDWTPYDSFLSSPSRCTHVSGDGAVRVTLSVRASRPTGAPGGPVTYTAIQTLTPRWAGQQSRQAHELGSSGGPGPAKPRPVKATVRVRRLHSPVQTGLQDGPGPVSARHPRPFSSWPLYWLLVSLRTAPLPISYPSSVPADAPFGPGVPDPGDLAEADAPAAGSEGEPVRQAPLAQRVAAIGPPSGQHRAGGSDGGAQL